MADEIRRNSNAEVETVKSGQILQEVYQEIVGGQDYGAPSSGIPFDNTAPQITEGHQIFSLTFTPKEADSIIEIECQLQIDTDRVSGDNMSIALFLNNNTDAIRTVFWGNANSSRLETVPFFRYRFVHSGSGSIPVQIRSSGNATDDVRINYATPSTPDVTFGNTLHSWIKITEKRAIT